MSKCLITFTGDYDKLQLFLHSKITNMDIMRLDETLAVGSLKNINEIHILKGFNFDSTTLITDIKNISDEEYLLKIEKLKNKATPFNSTSDYMINSRLTQNRLSNRENDVNYRQTFGLDSILPNNIVNAGLFNCILNKSLLGNVFKYLDVEDIANIKLTNTTINQYIESDSIISGKFYLKIIKRKNDKILQLQADKNMLPIQEEYLTSNEYIENLIKTYVQLNKCPGDKLKMALAKCIEFIETAIKPKLEKFKNQIVKDVLQHTTPIKNQPPTETSSYGNFLGVFGGLFAGHAAKTAEKSDNKSESNVKGSQTPVLSSPKSSSKTLEKLSDNASMSTLKSNNTFDNSDNLLVAKSKNEKYDTYIQDFNSTPFELVKVFKEYIKRDMSNNEVSQFFNQLVQWFSELLFNTKQTLNEIKELNLIKEVLNARYKSFNKRILKLELDLEKSKSQISDLSNFKTKLDEFNKYKETSERNMTLLEQENIRLKGKSAENNNMISLYKNKWLSTEEEYNKFKELYREELRNFNWKYNKLKEERDASASLMVDFRKFCDKNDIFHY